MSSTMNNIIQFPSENQYGDGKGQWETYRNMVLSISLRRILSNIDKGEMRLGS